MQQRNSLALEAYKRGMTEAETLRWALENSTSIDAAAKLLKVSTTSIHWNMEKYGLRVKKIVRLQVEHADPVTS